jgi:hypothetical protein
VLLLVEPDPISIGERAVALSGEARAVRQPPRVLRESVDDGAEPSPKGVVMPAFPMTLIKCDRCGKKLAWISGDASAGLHVREMLCYDHVHYSSNADTNPWWEVSKTTFTSKPGKGKKA